MPRSLAATFGTPELVARARAIGCRHAELLLPPIDVKANAPDLRMAATFRRAHEIHDTDIVLASVSRLTHSMKSDGLFRAMAAVRRLGRELPLRFLIVGDGDARTALERGAETVNRELGRRAIVMLGALLDPRPAYAAADIVIGMGGSALRGMAFGKPVIVVGESGFCAPFTPETAEAFYHRGLYGRGNDGADSEDYSRDILGLAQRGHELRSLGEFSREFVRKHFSLETVAARLDELCRDAVNRVPSLHAATADALRTTAVYLRERRFMWRADRSVLSEGAELLGSTGDDTRVSSVKAR
jgi:glycosyltransferase involved in cell wall biosynthesis